MKKLILILFLLSGVYFSAEAQQKTYAAPDVQVRMLNFYPNPASSYINFEFVKGYSADYTLQIYNFIGRPVLKVNKLSYRTTINLGDFYRGIYIFKLYDKNGTILETGKFQVVK